MKVEFELFEEHEGRMIIAEPIGWQDAVASLERDKNFYSLNESFSSPLKLWGNVGGLAGGRDWVFNVRKKWGVNARITGKIWFNPHDRIDPGMETITTETTPITIPDFVDWITRSVSSAVDWTEGSIPEVNLAGVLFTPQSSEIIYCDYAFVAGRSYTINITTNTDYNSGNSNPRNLNLRILDNAFNTLFENIEASPPTPGGVKVVSLTFTATEDCERIGIMSTQGSDVNITLTAKSGTQTITTQQVTAGSRLLFEGQLPIPAMTDVLDLDFTTQTAWTPIGIWADFLKRFGTAVDVTSTTALDGRAVNVIPSKILPLPSQVLKRKSTYEGPLDAGVDITNEDYVNEYPNGGDLISENFTTYGQGVIEINQNEILNSITGLLFNVDSVAPADVAPALDIAAEESGDLKIFLKPGAKLSGGVRGRIFANDLDPTQNEITAIDIAITLWVVKNADAPLLLGAGAASLGGVANPSTPLTQTIFNNTFGDLELTSFEQTITVAPADEIRVYLRYIVSFTADVNTEQQIEWTERFLYIDAYNSQVEFSFDSVFPATSTPAFLIHDVGYGIMDRILQLSNVFYSERLGNLTTIREYLEKGPDSEYLITKFLQLRGYSLDEKKPFISFETWWKGVDGLFNLGLGFTNKEVDNTFKTIIEVEEKGKFFDDSEMSLVLLNVKYIERSYDSDFYFNEVGVGIDKGEPEDLQGVDDPKKHYWTTLFNGIGKKFEVFTEFIFQSMTIESARRKRATKSTDYKYDNEIAIISVVPQGLFIPEPWPPLSVFGSISADPDSHWTYDIDNPFLTIDAGHPGGETDIYFSTVQITYEEGKTYKYKVTVEASIASGTADIRLELVLHSDASVGSITQIESSPIRTVNAGVPETIELEWEFVPGDALQKHCSIRADVISSAGGDLTMTVISKEDLTESVAGGDSYTPRIDEGFSEVAGLENSNTRYNKIITPGRIFLRWQNFFACCLQDYVNSLFRTGAGEGNYAMTSTMDDNGEPESYGGELLAENANIVVGDNFLFQPIPYKIKKHPITFDQYQHLLQNKKLSIGISQTDGNAVPFFIWKLDAKLFKGEMDLIVYPKHPFDIVRVANPLPPSTYIFDDSFERGPGGFNEQAG